MPWALGVETIWELEHQGLVRVAGQASGPGEPPQTLGQGLWWGVRGWEQSWDMPHGGKPARPLGPTTGSKWASRGFLEEAAQGTKGTGGGGSGDPRLLSLTRLQLLGAAED